VFLCNFFDKSYFNYLYSKSLKYNTKCINFKNHSSNKIQDNINTVQTHKLELISAYGKYDNSDYRNQFFFYYKQNINNLYTPFKNCMKT